MSDLLILARGFAIGAHTGAGQFRKYNGGPYWLHPERVAKTLYRRGFPDEVIAAGWLHDTVEDTAVTKENIHYLFGNIVGALVEEVTDVAVASDGNRRERHIINTYHIAKGSFYGKSIKLADTLDNAPSIIENDPAFAKVWVKEKLDLLDHIRDDSDEVLFEQVFKLLNAFNS